MSTEAVERLAAALLSANVHDDAEDILAADPDLAAAIDLGLAWHEAEAALPDKRYVLLLARRSVDGTYRVSGYRAGPRGASYQDPHTDGGTPAEALRNLAARLRESTP